MAKSARLDWKIISEWVDGERLNKTCVNEPLKERKARFVVPPLGGTVIPPKGGTTNLSFADE
jgi:hypothetical protein